MPLPLQPELLAGLRAFRHRNPRLLPVDRRHLDFASERRRRHRDGHPAEQVGPVALEKLMWLDRKENIKIARGSASQPRLAFSGKADACSVLDSSRDIHGQRALLGDAPGPMASGCMDLR